MAESAWFRGRGGGLHCFSLPLSPAFAAQERAGRLVRVDPPASPTSAAPAAARGGEAPAVVTDKPAALVREEFPSRPADTAKVAVWREYARAVGGPTPGDVDNMTKAQLIDRFGG